VTDNRLRVVVDNDDDPAGTPISGFSRSGKDRYGNHRQCADRDRENRRFHYSRIKGESRRLVNRYTEIIFRGTDEIRERRMDY